MRGLRGFLVGGAYLLSAASFGQSIAFSRTFPVNAAGFLDLQNLEIDAGG
jgi:hypothetical protein